MKKRNILIAASFMMGLASCNTLDLEPLDSIDELQFWGKADASALEQYCNDLYPKLISGHGDPQTYGFGMMDRDFQSDNLLTWEYNKVSFGHHLAPTEAKDTEWKWEVNRACNIFIQNYQQSPAAEKDKKQYLGEILFLKSMDYYNKVKAYNNVPWYSKPLKPGDADLYKARDPRSLVMDSVLNDLTKAVSLLSPKTKVYRISKDAALALKARVCLFEGTYRRYHGIEGDTKFLQAAYDAAGELMKSEYGYSLFQGSSPAKAYYELFIQTDYNSNSEVIFSKEYDPAKAKGNNIGRQIFKGETPIGMSKDAADDYLCATTGKPISMCGCPGHTNHTTFVAELQNRDPRMLQTIATPEVGDFTYYLEGKAPAIEKLVDQDVAGDPTSQPKGRGASSSGYCIVKFYNPAEAGEIHHQGSIDAPIFRFAEILLIRAEAGAELGLDPELSKTVNALRQRVGFNFALTESPLEDPKLVSEYPVIKGANANLIREIRRERRIEMMAEGLRYDDILRWKIGAQLAKTREGFIPDPTLYTTKEIAKLKEICGITANGTLEVYGKRVDAEPEFNEVKHYLLSIPINEMGLNPNLKPNNPGW